MILNDRQAEILDFLKENGRASVRRLARDFLRKRDDDSARP